MRTSACLAVVVLALTCACSSTESGAPPKGVRDATAIDPTQGDSARGDEGGLGRAPSTTLRLAHLSPDLGDVDFCYRAVPDAPFIGPVLGGAGSPKDAGAPSDAARDASDAGADAGADAMRADAGAADAATLTDASVPVDAGMGTAIPYLGVSGDLTLTGSGTFEIAIVDAAAQSCGAPRLVGHVTLDDGKRSTVALLGRVNADAGSAGELALIAFTDDPRADANNARIRFLHAALGTPKRAAEPTLAASAVGTADAEIALAAQIEPRHVASASSTSPVIDALGYQTLAPLGGLAQLRLTRPKDAGAAASTTAATSLDITAGSIHTAFVVSDDAASVAILWCADGQVKNDLTSCVLLRP